MTKTDWHRREALIYGQQIINELDEPEFYEPDVHSNGFHRFLNIYDKRTHDSVLCIQAPTYYDLYIAVMCAVNAHNLMKRGF